MSADLHLRVTELERRLENIVIIGTIIKADYDQALVRVESGDLKTGWLPWLTQRAGGDRSWNAPEVGEQVVVFSPSGEPAQGVVLPALFQTASPAPAKSADITQTIFGDGLKISHDRSTNRTVIDATANDGTLEFRAKNIIHKTGKNGFYHVDHYGYATRITHMGGAAYQSETWNIPAVVTGIPDHGHNPPEVEIL